MSIHVCIYLRILQFGKSCFHPYGSNYLIKLGFNKEAL